MYIYILKVQVSHAAFMFQPVLPLDAGFNDMFINEQMKILYYLVKYNLYLHLDLFYKF